MGVVMSIDTGNKMMKTNHFIFHSGIKRKEQKILPGEEGIFFKGINYLESNQRISYLEDKTIDDRYYILTLLGVAKELEKEGIETGIYEGGNHSDPVISWTSAGGLRKTDPKIPGIFLAARKSRLFFL